MVTLRAWTDDDRWLLHQTLGNPAMMKYLGGTESRPRIDERHASYVGDRDMFTVRDGDVVVGSAGFWQRDWHGIPVYEAGWMILPRYAGQGFATQAALALIALARAEAKCRFLHAFPNAENEASNRVCRKAGFTAFGPCSFEYPRGRWMRCIDWRIELLAHDVE